MSVVPINSNEVLVKSRTHDLRLVYWLKKSRNDGHFCDITLIAKKNDQRIVAHRVVLAATSEYFLAMFTCGLQESSETEVILNDVHGDQLVALVDFCYSGKICINTDNVEDLLTTASLLQFNDVLNMCVDFLLKQMDPSNCIGFNVIGNHYRCKKLKNLSHEYICEHFQKVCIHQEFVLLDVCTMRRILNCTELNVRSEVLIFDSLMSWIHFDFAERYKHFGYLLRGIRLAHLSNRFIERTVLPLCVYYKSEDVLYEGLTRLIEGAAHQQRRKGNSGLLAVFCGGLPACINLEQYFDDGDYWQRLANIPLQCYVFGSVILHEKLLIIGGICTEDKSVLNAVHSIDLRTKEVSSRAPMAIKRYSLCVAEIFGIVYAVGGINGPLVLNTVERYDPATDSWSFVAPLREAIVCAAAAVLAGQLYVVGGSNSSTPNSASTQVYDPDTDQWAFRAELNHGRRNFGLSANKGFLYAVGGFVCRNAHIVERYDPQINIWISLYSIVTKPCLAFNAFLSDDRLLTVVANVDLGKSSLSVEEYNIRTAQFRSGAESPEREEAVMLFGLCNVFPMP